MFTSLSDVALVGIFGAACTFLGGVIKGFLDRKKDSGELALQIAHELRQQLTDERIRCDGQLDAMRREIDALRAQIQSLIMRDTP